MDKDKRALRFFNNERIAKKRAKHQAAYEGSEKNNSIRRDTPTRCSCALCGNPRKYTGKMTLQEIRMCQEMGWEYDEDYSALDDEDDSTLYDPRD